MKALILAVSIFMLFVSTPFVYASDYQLGPEDVVSVVVLRHAEFSGEFLIPSDGRVSFPGVGEVMVTGKSLSELSATLTDKLSSRLRSPEVSVTLKSQREFRVYVSGRVKNPGIYDLRENRGLLEAIALAGGALDDAALSRVMITGVARKSEVVDLSAAGSGSKTIENPKLSPGDLVVVPESTNRVAVLGYVNAPDYFTLKDGQKVTLSDALSLAKGVISRKGRVDSILILRTSNGKQQRLEYDLGKFLKNGDVQQNPDIQPGDVVYVPAGKNPTWDSLIRALSSISIFANAIY